MLSKLKTLLSIAGSDPLGGAGIQADIRIGSHIGLHVLTAVTAVTSQNSKGIRESGFIHPDLLKAQLEAILEDVSPDGVKIGLVGNIENYKVITAFLDSLPVNIPIVLDPVLKVTVPNIKSKKMESEIAAISNYMLQEVFPRATVVTPNLEELNFFLPNLNDKEDYLKLLNTKALIIKGGHGNENIISDVLITPDFKETFSHKRRDCQNLHGTGCVFSSMLASFMALGENLKEAFNHTCVEMNEIISKSSQYKLGCSTYGPLNINDKYILK